MAIHQRANDCVYTAYLEKYLTFTPPPGKFPLPLDLSSPESSKCDLFSDILIAARRNNPCSNFYHITDTCPLLSTVLGTIGPSGYSALGLRPTSTESMLRLRSTLLSGRIGSSVPKSMSSEEPATTQISQIIHWALHRTAYYSMSFRQSTTRSLVSAILISYYQQTVLYWLSKKSHGMGYKASNLSPTLNSSPHTTQNTTADHLPAPEKSDSGAPNGA